MPKNTPKPLTVGELIEILKTYRRPDAKVVIASDAEGNAFHLLCGHEPAEIASEQWGRVEVRGSRHLPSTAPAVILWPLG